MATDLTPTVEKQAKTVLNQDGFQVQADKPDTSILNKGWKPKKPAPAPAVKM